MSTYRELMAGRYREIHFPQCVTFDIKGNVFPNAFAFARESSRGEKDDESATFCCAGTTEGVLWVYKIDKDTYEYRRNDSKVHLSRPWIQVQVAKSAITCVACGELTDGQRVVAVVDVCGTCSLWHLDKDAPCICTIKVPCNVQCILWTDQRLFLATKNSVSCFSVASDRMTPAGRVDVGRGNLVSLCASDSNIFATFRDGNIVAIDIPFQGNSKSGVSVVERLKGRANAGSVEPGRCSLDVSPDGSPDVSPDVSPDGSPPDRLPGGFKASNDENVYEEEDEEEEAVSRDSAAYVDEGMRWLLASKRKSARKEESRRNDRENVQAIKALDTSIVSTPPRSKMRRENATSLSSRWRYQRTDNSSLLAPSMDAFIMDDIMSPSANRPRTRRTRAQTDNERRRTMARRANDNIEKSSELVVGSLMWSGGDTSSSSLRLHVIASQRGERASTTLQVDKLRREGSEWHVTTLCAICAAPLASDVALASCAGTSSTIVVAPWIGISSLNHHIAACNCDGSVYFISPPDCGASLPLRFEYGRRVQAFTASENGHIAFATFDRCVEIFRVTSRALGPSPYPPRGA